MTTPIEALEQAVSFARQVACIEGVRRAPEMKAIAEQYQAIFEQALASLEGDAVERVARIINPDAFCSNPDPDEPEFWRKAARHLAREKARAILATGLVAGEAERPLGDVFNELVRRMNFDGMDPRTFTLGELERAIDGAEFPK